MRRMPRRRAFPCPHCEATVPAGALSCPECGSDAQTGWSEEAESFAGEIPTGYDDEDFDYEEALREAGLAADGQPSRAQLRRRRVIAVCLLLLVLVLLWTFGR